MNFRKTIRKIIGSMVVCMTFGAGMAQAATVYVDVANTTGIEDGTDVSPFNTIQEGINAALAGDTVLVSPGVYHGAIELKDSVLLKGDKGPKLTIIDGDGTGNVIIMPYSIPCRTSIEGFTVKNGSTLVFVSNRVNFWSGSEFRANNCIFTGWGRAAINSYPASKTYVTRSLFYSQDLTGQVWEKMAYESIWCGNGEFTNVTVDNVNTGFMMYQTGVQLINTTVSNTTNMAATWGSRGSGYVYANYTNFFNVTNQVIPGDNGQLPYLNISNTLAVEPQFMNASTFDYRLSPASSLIDAGINVGLPYNGTAPDIGAYEVNVSIPEMVEALAHSYQDVPLDAYKNAGEQRRHALSNKFVALLKQIDAIKETMPRDEKLAAWQEALDKLLNDIWAKGDGFYGGNPKNDWITTQEEQARLKEKVDEVAAAIRDEIAKL